MQSPSAVTRLLRAGVLVVLATACADHDPTGRTLRPTAPAAALVPTSITFTPAEIVGGGQVMGQVNLSGIAGPGGIPVTLTSLDPTVATLEATDILVPQGTSSRIFFVQTAPVSEPVGARISATANGESTTGVLNVIPGEASAIASFTLSTKVLESGQTATGTVTLNGPAPEGGAVVDLLSRMPDLANLPATLTIPAGALSGTFEIVALPGTWGGFASFGATWKGITVNASLTIVEAGPTGRQIASLTLSAEQVIGGEPVTGTVTLASADGEATVVELESSTPSVATVPASVTVPAGEASATFLVGTSVTSQVDFAVITGRAGGAEASASLTTIPRPDVPTIASLTLFPSTIGGGGPATGRVTLDRETDDGVVVPLTSANPSVVQVEGEVTVRPGERIGDFRITTSPVNATTPVTITASGTPTLPIGSASATMTVTTDPPPPPDQVRITRVRFRPGGRGGTLTVTATSSSATAILIAFRGAFDGENPPTFGDATLRNLGGGRYEATWSFSGPRPTQVNVVSNLGGWDSERVR